MKTMENEKIDKVFEITNAEQIRSAIENPNFESILRERVFKISELDLQLLDIYGIHFSPRDENIRITRLIDQNWLEALGLKQDIYPIQVTPSGKYPNSKLIRITDKFTDRIEEGSAYICITHENEDLPLSNPVYPEKSNE